LEASVVIPTRNAGATIGATLAGLARQVDAPSFEVIVVDDGSEDDTDAVIAASELDVVQLETAGGQGPAAARNLGASRANGRMLVFVDADCEPEPDWLAGLLETARDAELVQGAVLPPEGLTVGPFDRFVIVVSEYGLYQTANLAIRRDLFERIGGFESIIRPRVGKELGEDVWLAWRARRTGARTRFARDAVVRHAVFPRGPLGYLSELRRVAWFPKMARLMPELRTTSLYRRWFLTGRSARFDLALAGAIGALALGHWAPLLAALPYAWLSWRDSGRFGRRRRPIVGPVYACGDIVRFLALVAGSLRARSLVI
jgi:glycosyltransferase involved in cell wall biosynthesis